MGRLNEKYLRISEIPPECPILLEFTGCFRLASMCTCKWNLLIDEEHIPKGRMSESNIFKSLFYALWEKNLYKTEN